MTKEYLLCFGTKTQCTDGAEGRVVGLRANTQSRSIEAIVVRPNGGSAQDHIVLAKMAEIRADVIAIECTGPELERLPGRVSVASVLPATACPRLYPPWQPFQQIWTDIHNPFGRVLIGPTHPVLEPTEVEMSPGQVLFGTDGVVGRLGGVVTEEVPREITKLLIERVRPSRKGFVGVPVDLLADWETRDLLVNSRQLDSFRTLGRASGALVGVRS
jgi:hypothetical protein